MTRSTECDRKETPREMEVNSIRRIFGEDMAKTYEHKVGAIPGEKLPQRKVISEYDPHERGLG